MNPYATIKTIVNFKTGTEMFTKGTVIYYCPVVYVYVPHSRGAGSGYSHNGPGEEGWLVGEEGGSEPGRRRMSRGEEGRGTAACF